MTLFKNGRYKRFLIHRLVAKAFLPHDIFRNQVNHIDGNKTNNNISNIEWCSSSENQTHRRDILKKKFATGKPVIQIDNKGDIIRQFFKKHIIMTSTYFECKVSYENIMEDGKQKKVTEPYLIEALSFTEAEARIIEELTPFIGGEFVIKDIKRAKLSEIFFNENGDRFYKIKVYFITLEEKSGAEKKTAAQMLIQASNLKEAIEVLEKGMKGTLVDYEIASVSETAIMDILPYDAEDDKNTDKTANTSNPSVRKFFQSLPEGCKTEIVVSGKKIIVDKTGRETVVTQMNEE